MDASYSVEDPFVFESLVFNAENWFVAQDIVVNAIDDEVILESPYGSLLRVVALEEMVDVNVTLLVSEGDSGESLSPPVTIWHPKPEVSIIILRKHMLAYKLDATRKTCMHTNIRTLFSEVA